MSNPVIVVELKSEPVLKTFLFKILIIISLILLCFSAGDKSVKVEYEPEILPCGL